MAQRGRPRKNQDPEVPASKFIHRWQRTTYRVHLNETPEVLHRMMQCLAVYKYTWNWALADWEFQEMRAMVEGNRDYPDEAQVYARFMAQASDYVKGVPECIPKMCIDRFANTYMFAKTHRRVAVLSFDSSRAGTFRLDKSICSVNDDRTVLSIQGIGDIEMDDCPRDMDYGRIRYLTFRRYSEKTFVVYFVFGAPELEQGGTFKKITYDSVEKYLKGDSLVARSEVREDTAYPEEIPLRIKTVQGGFKSKAVRNERVKEDGGAVCGAEEDLDDGSRLGGPPAQA